MSIISRDAVASLMEEAAEKLILPRFQKLQADDISTKSSATDYVTIADQEAEEWLTPRLGKLVDCPVIGEEAVASNPALRDLAGEGMVWTVDPVDGTANFVEGNDRFCVMISLAENGVPLQSWIWMPLQRELYYAAAGEGAHLLTAGISSALRAVATTTDLASILGGGSAKGLVDPLKSVIQKRLRAMPNHRSIGCAGVQGALLASGKDEFMAHGRCTPWDHAPVDLLCREAGCHAGMVGDGSAYHTANHGPFMVAANKAIWDYLADNLWADCRGDLLK